MNFTTNINGCQINLFYDAENRPYTTITGNTCDIPQAVYDEAKRMRREAEEARIGNRVAVMAAEFSGWHSAFAEAVEAEQAEQYYRDCRVVNNRVVRLPVGDLTRDNARLALLAVSLKA
jgi:hypothetical protein